MIRIARNVSIPDEEVELEATRAQGPGGQNVNKVASAVQLRFDIRGSSLPGPWKHRLMALKDGRITERGVVVIKAQRYRSQEMNRADALERLRSLVAEAVRTRKRRIPTRPSRAARQKRLDEKKSRARVKSMRGRVRD